MLKRILRKGVRMLSHWLYEDNLDAVRDSRAVYPWINAVLLKTLRESPLMRPSYLWGARSTGRISQRPWISPLCH